MAQLDRFLTALVEYKAEALLLEQDQYPAFKFVSGYKSVSKSKIGSSKIVELVCELTSDDVLRELEAEGSSSFIYELEGHEYSGVISREEAGVVARIWDASQSMGGEDGMPPESLLSAPHAPVSGHITAVAAAVQAVAAPVRAPVGEINLPSLDEHSTEDLIPDDLPPNYRQRIDGLLQIMAQKGASDLHLCVGMPPIYRIDGDMLSSDGPPMEADELFRLILSISPRRNRDEFLQRKDTDCAYAIEGVSRYRCNYFFDRNGPGAVFRAVPSEIVSAKTLGLPKVICDLAKLNKGLVLVTGPTGCGKSTTLAAILDLANQSRRDHVITIEDPIEFVHSNKKCLVNQRQVGVHTDGFKEALRAALREDPDIVLVGELRDLETVEIAVETAETGHLVFATLHTTTAASTVDRLIDQFPSDQQAQIRVMLSESLRAVISQTLCKKKGGGRVAALEILLGTGSVANLIREGKTFQIDSCIQTGKKQGMQTLNDHLLALVSKGLVEPMEAYLKSVDKTGLKDAMGRQGIELET
jgi:twitching motility protein PilT